MIETIANNKCNNNIIATLRMAYVIASCSTIRRYIVGQVGFQLFKTCVERARKYSLVIVLVTCLFNIGYIYSLLIDSFVVFTSLIRLVFNGFNYQRLIKR